MQLNDKNVREQKFHDELHKNSGVRFENRFYKALKNMFDDFDYEVEKSCKNKEILDYGCGIGHNMEKFLKFSPKKITGVDVSEVSINKAKKNLNNKDLSKINFVHGNCEELTFEDQSFGLIYGSGILHHLKFDLAFKEISRTLKIGGKVIFVEPLGTNPLINLYRRLTPKSRSVDEHPFEKKDFLLLEKYFNEIKIKYYGFLTLIFFPFYKKPDNSFFFKLLANFDQKLFRINFFKKMAWSVMIIGKKN